MRIIVQKFGGGVIKDTKLIEQVADIIAQTKTKNTAVAVVVSAMGDTTDDLLKLAKKINPALPGRETDMLLTSGERITMSLLTLALLRKGYDALSFTGSQVGIITNEQHSDARIVEIRGTRLKHALAQGKIPIVAGFQGVSLNREITTLGRGGSDITAVAIAAYLNAKQCELYKDVPGVFTEDPKTFANVKHIPLISYDEMAELTNAGSEILQPRACALASKYNIDLAIKCFFRKDCETMITGNKKLLNKHNNQHTEKAFVRAITHSNKLARLSLVAVPKLPKCLHQVIVRLAQAKIPLLFFAHGVPYQNKFDLSFIVSAENYSKAKTVLEKTTKIVNAEKLEIAHNLASISLVGPGISNDTEIFSALFDVLHKLGIHIDAFSSSEMKITCFLRQENLKKAVSTLLKKFNLVNMRKGYK
jgi:aspartate kinase